MNKSTLPVYHIGSLVWCRWSTLKWPAMITYDPHQAVYFRTSGQAVTHYHVQYFGIKAQRGWVKSKDISQLLAGEEKFAPQRIKKNLQQDYEVAIKEVRQALKMGVKQRKLRFVFNYAPPQRLSKAAQRRAKRPPLATQQETVGSRDQARSHVACPEHAPKEQPSLSSDTELVTLPVPETRLESLLPANPQLVDAIDRTNIPPAPTVSVGGGHLSTSTPPDILTPPSTSSDADSTDNEQCSEITEEIPIPSLAKAKQAKAPTYPIQRTLCDICSDQGDCLLTCSGHCFRSFHLDCLGLASLPKFAFVCDECILAQSSCFLCHASDGELTACSHPRCDKQYHLPCIQSHKLFQVDATKSTLSCALHRCARCSMEETLHCPPKRSCKLIQCIKCPFSLHKSTCLTAGCVTLDDSRMVCYRHLVVNSSFPHSLRHINMNSCLECGEAGTLICCEFCPATYHSECLPEESRPGDGSDSNWLCPSCSVLDLPIYGSVVLCKCGNYRWWPAVVVLEKSIPEHMLPSKPAKGMFLVLFYGTGQYQWTNHGRVIAFTDDANWVEAMVKKSKSGCHHSSKAIDQVALFRKACEEALAVFREQKAEKEEAQSYRKDSKSYYPIKRNKYLVPKPALEREIEPCQCTTDDPCSSSSHCINRDLLIECSPSNCPVGDSCCNQRISRQQTANTYPFHTGTRGWGLKAKHDLVEGDFVVEYVGEVLDRSMCLERLKESQEKSISNYYFLTLKSNLVIDASRKSNHARFINHSCNPNCTTEKWTVHGETRIGIFATKDIPAGTELTFDYRLDCLGNEKLRCLCGADNCSGFIGEKPRHSQEQQPLQQRGKKATKTRRKRRASTKATRTKLAKMEAPEEDHEDECFLCKDGGDLMLCDYPGCPKVYHPSCLNLAEVPDETFHCPCHVCSQCSDPATAHCTQCPSSFCITHSSSQLQSGPDEQLYCLVHSST